MIQSTSNARQSNSHQLEITWKGKQLRVIRKIHSGEWSILYLVKDRNNSHPRVLKVFLPPDYGAPPEGVTNGPTCKFAPGSIPNFSKVSFDNEVRAYELLASVQSPYTPCYYGSSKFVTIRYPNNSRIPDQYQLRGKQRAILIQYLRGAELISPFNITEEIGRKALEALRYIHHVKICHRDINNFKTPQNFLLLQDGSVRLVDFEHSSIESADEKMIGFEQDIAEQILGPDGHLMTLRRSMISDGRITCGAIDNL